MKMKIDKLLMEPRGELVSPLLRMVKSIMRKNILGLGLDLGCFTTPLWTIEKCVINVILVADEMPMMRDD